MFHFLSVDIFLPFSCCLFQNVSHSPSLSSCHSPLRFPLPSSTLISHYQRCHVGEWMLWGSRGMFSASAKRPAKCETPLWNIYPNLLRFTPFLSHILNATYKAIHLQSSRWSVSSVFLLFIWLIGRKDKKTKRQQKKEHGDLLKHNVAPWWQEEAVRCSAEAFLHQPAALVFAFILLTQCLGFHCQVCSWFREDTAHWSSIQKLQNSIWGGRWFTLTVSLISQ